MAGSNKWFVYTTDDNEEYGIQLDESNTEELNGSTNDFVPALSIKYALPRNLRPRSVYYRNAAGTRTIRCIALTPTIYAGALVGKPTINDPLTSGQTLGLIRLRPEVITRLPFAQDTGLNDGDAT